jgi:hypothetical protein
MRELKLGLQLMFGCGLGNELGSRLGTIAFPWSESCCWAWPLQVSPLLEDYDYVAQTTCADATQPQVNMSLAKYATEFPV